MPEMRYANAKFLIYCYPLPVTARVEMLMCLRYAFVLPSFCLRFRFAPIDGASTDLQRIYNGPGTDLHRRELIVLANLIEASI